MYIMVKLLFIYLSNNFKGLSRFFLLDNVWNSGLLHKICRYGISWRVYSVIKSFLSSRSKNVIVNGQSSESQQINADAPKSSLLGPTLFINNLPKDILRSLVNIYLYTDNTTVDGCTFKIWMIPSAWQPIPLLIFTPTG